VINMVGLPDEVMKAINDPKSARVLGTKSEEGNVHLVQLGSLKAASPEMIIAGAILMKHTSKNLENAKADSSLISILVTVEMKSYEVRARVKDFVTHGPVFDQMNAALKPMGMQARGVWIFEPAEVWNQSATYDAGKKMV
jgi:hypothetical protein